MTTATPSASIPDELRAMIRRAVARNGGSAVARKPAHRVMFHWPPHPISYSYHVLASDWTGTGTFEAHGEQFDVEIARTAHGVFGRVPAIWHEDRGETEAEMLENLRLSSEPLFRRQLAISEALETPGRFTGHIGEIDPLGLLKLLYCEDRDVANEARIQIDTHASTHDFLPGLLTIINDQSHPNRRSAQWCVLDLFEDLPSFARTDEERIAAVDAMKRLIWSAEDDYARTIYKAGAVLGGHIPFLRGGPTLLECLEAPSRIGRRSAIHGLFHVVEWIPEMRGEVVAALTALSEREPEPELRDFARLMARDIASEETDHIPEPLFANEG